MPGLDSVSFSKNRRVHSKSPLLAPAPMNFSGTSKDGTHDVYRLNSTA